MSAPLLELRHLSKTFQPRQDAVARLLAKLSRQPAPHAVHAVNDVSLSIQTGQVLGIVGESGCGKSTLARMAAQLLAPTSGTVLYDGQDVATMDGPARRRTTLDIQMVFQNPYASLNPRKRVGDLIMEAPLVHGLTAPRDRHTRLAELLGKVGLDMAAARRYPHQFSGGQRQRISIARALAVRPRLLICDEAVAALDVSIQAQILNLLQDLRSQEGLTYLFISHDLGVVHHLCDEVVIMYLGRVVEQAPTERLFAEPRHPYTQALLDAVPTLGTGKREYPALYGELPSPLAPPSGCHFHPRCPQAMPRCKTEVPVYREVAPGHRAACHLNDMAPTAS
ncbi:MAG: ATP-binding cassette domain-containing protein [Rhodocyclaceae bacterium]